MRIRISTIDLDASIQCRANIDTATVNEYAERMTEGDTFPPIVLFGTKERSWIGDGWHRVLAARQIALVQIEALLNPGGRIDALKSALSANAAHGQRRTNADKRRCVEIALREFPKLSNVQIGKLCGVSDMMVATWRPINIKNLEVERRLGADGKERPAHREPANHETPSSGLVCPHCHRKDVGPLHADNCSVASSTHHEEVRETPPQTARPMLGPPRDGMGFASLAIMDLEKIRPDDAEREEAFAHVKGWLIDHGA